MRCVFEMDYNGEYCVTTADVLVAGGVDYSAEVFAKLGYFWTDIAEDLSNQLHLQVIKLDGVSNSVSIAGTNAATALPGNCAIRYLKRAVVGRGGSMNLPGLLEAQVGSNGLIEAAPYAQFVTKAEAAFASLTDDDITMVIARPGIAVAVTELGVSPRIGTFRNRMFGR